MFFCFTVPPTVQNLQICLKSKSRLREKYTSEFGICVPNFHNKIFSSALSGHRSRRPPMTPPGWLHAFSFFGNFHLLVSSGQSPGLNWISPFLWDIRIWHIFLAYLKLNFGIFFPWKLGNTGDRPAHPALLNWTLLSFLLPLFFEIFPTIVAMSVSEYHNVFKEIEEGKKHRYAIFKITDGEIKLEKVRSFPTHYHLTFLCHLPQFQTFFTGINCYFCLSTTGWKAWELVRRPLCRPASEGL